MEDRTVKRLVDLSHVIEAGMTMFKGLPGPNICDFRTREASARSLLLGADIPIGEHLTNLAALPDVGFRFSAVPPKVAGMGTFPVRAYAEL